MSYRFFDIRRNKLANRSNKNLTGSLNSNLNLDSFFSIIIRLFLKFRYVFLDFHILEFLLLNGKPYYPENNN